MWGLTHQRYLYFLFIKPGLGCVNINHVVGQREFKLELSRAENEVYQVKIMRSWIEIIFKIYSIHSGKFKMERNNLPANPRQTSFLIIWPVPS